LLFIHDFDDDMDEGVLRERSDNSNNNNTCSRRRESERASKQASKRER